MTQIKMEIWWWRKTFTGYFTSARGIRFHTDSFFSFGWYLCKGSYIFFVNTILAGLRRKSLPSQSLPILGLDIAFFYHLPLCFTSTFSFDVDSLSLYCFIFCVSFLFCSVFVQKKNRRENIISFFLVHNICGVNTLWGK